MGDAKGYRTPAELHSSKIHRKYVFICMYVVTFYYKTTAELQIRGTGGHHVGGRPGGPEV